mmetsp:Transcript_44363/g.53609  ORF Transcript_44363/g.53609 Transcript_44363/m.53609 type:complete len:412 (-) Transcript_44363:112-1347(-)|eukprot:CAMPEP_0172489402 /NCGR_PEP_ID=MMETSP1066-20121228/19363_1 /TAXON_ID=671091 /ORGANISM="Coscinodiscus wailesii, Strain CCMP2513" /LENGTH=411 /DNA_ID=CAMNT_0013257215 /DNA_START=183 /DNA_END=1418 /DNA_ORIENTATION=-
MTEKKNKTSKKGPKSHVTTSLPQLLEQAETASMTDPTVALALYQTARDQIQNNLESSSDTERADNLLLARVLGRSGDLRVSLGDLEGGKDDFIEGITILTGVEEEEGKNEEERREIMADLYMYLGQTGDGEESLEWYKKGVDTLEGCLKIVVTDTKSDETAVNETRQKLCSAYCTLAELYLTDLCFAPNAESECESHLANALKHDTGLTPDALQTVANLRLSQSRADEATDAILKVWERMKLGCEALAKLVGLGPDGEEGTCGELGAVEEANSLPGFEFRCQSAKLLLEAGGTQDAEKKNRCCEAAVAVLGSLLAENDEVVEIWYLVGCAFFNMEPRDGDAAKVHWERALEMLETVKGDLMKREGEDMMEEEEEEGIEENIKEIEQRITDIRERLSGIGTESNEGSTMVQE